MPDTDAEAPGRLRLLVAVPLATACGIFLFAAVAGLTGLWTAALAIGVIAAIFLARVFWTRPVIPLDPAACSRALGILAAVAAFVALVQLGRLAAFMVSPANVACSTLPSSDWEVHHSCLSAYYVAGKEARGPANIYEASLYTAPDDNPAARRNPLMLGPFRIDVFEYPPPFLTLPRALLLLTPDFMRFRALWFGLNGAVVLLAMVVVARRMGFTAGTRALLLSPLVWMALPTLSTLQKGNVQALVIAIAMLAMELFERRRWASGGALLAYATVSKLFPGLLAIHLLVQRRWRALAWTVTLGAALVVVSLIDVGAQPFAAFLQHLPGLLGGEAFPAFRNPAAMAVNLSVPGLAFKLKLFGVAGMSFGAAKILGWVYTAVALWAVVLLARRSPKEQPGPVVWMAVLIIATLRSPFLPQAYASFPPLWLLTLVAASLAPTARNVGLTLLGWAALNIFWPLDWPMDPRKLALLNAVPQALTIGLATLVVWRAATAPKIASSPPGESVTVAAAG